jgi:hypothetical protein
MIDQLLKLLDMIIEKEEKTEEIRVLLGGQGNEGYLLDERDQVYKTITMALGGSEEDFIFLNEKKDVFWPYSEGKRTEEDKKELIESIVYMLEDNFRPNNKS